MLLFIIFAAALTASGAMYLHKNVNGGYHSGRRHAAVWGLALATGALLILFAATAFSYIGA